MAPASQVDRSCNAQTTNLQESANNSTMRRQQQRRQLPSLLVETSCCRQARFESLSAKSEAMKCHSSSNGQKWLKSPQNRFKSARCKSNLAATAAATLRHRSQRSTARVADLIGPRKPESPPPLHAANHKPQINQLKSRICILFMLNTAMFLAAAMSQPQSPANSSLGALSSSAGGKNPPVASHLPLQPQVAVTSSSSTVAPRSIRSAGGRLATANQRPKASADVEADEVELLKPRQAQAGVQVHHQAHIYKIRSAPINGRLTLTNLPSQIQVSDALRRPSQLQQTDAAKPAQSTVSGPTPSLRDETTTSKADFGTRATEPQLVAITTPISVAALRRPQQQQQQQQQKQRQENCRQPDEEAQTSGSSIAATSQTLRLTGFERSLSRVAGGRPEVGALSGSAARTGELEENPGVLELEASGSGQVRGLRPTPIAARASAVGSGSGSGDQRLGSSSAGPLRLGNFAETSLATEPGSSGGGGGGPEEGAVGESRPATSGGSESILSLIDEYDSKIITNKTKAQLSCDSGEMILRLNFSEAFKGIVYPDHNRLSPCRFFGDGHHNYELRLPLRGCGTRQAAPRVFVNDVIVRFHKTLELEEDEVKTLICRYPPPLASIPLESSGEPSLSASGSRSTNNRPNEPGDPIEGGQFEFVDPQSGRPRPEPGSSGQIETISENLVVAPGKQQTLGSSQMNPYNQANPSDQNRIANNNRLNANLRQQKPSNSLIGFDSTTNPVDLFNQRNSFVGAGTESPSMQQNYFERLSSIELLFLISSLMFLVLLTLALIGSFYCFRRQANRANGQRASAILKRKRHYLSPAAAVSAAGPTLQQYQSQRRHQHRPGAPLVAVSASPSPGSDLSGRGLLAGSSSSLSAGAIHPGYLYNRAYQPEPPGGNLQRYLAAATAVGGHYDAQQRPMSVRSGLVRPPNEPVAAHPRRQQPPVLGRRDTIYGYANASMAKSGRLAEFEPARGHHRRIAEPRLRGSTFAAGQPGLAATDSQPLLLLGAEPTQYEPQHYRGRPKMRAHLQQQQEAAGLVSAQYALVNKARGQQPGLQVRASSSHPIHHHHQEQQQRQLWRAKSLSSVQQVAEAHNWRPNGQPVGGTLSRHEPAASRHRRRRQHNHYPAPEQVSDRNLHYGGYATAQCNLQFAAGTSRSSSESELEPNNNIIVNEMLQVNTKRSMASEHNRNQQQQQHRHQQIPQPKPKPKILLQSIEDSFITNFTEIHEQEYLKRDSMRPLSLGAWRAMQPDASHLQRGNHKREPHDEDTFGSSERDREEEEEEVEDQQEEQCYPSAQTNLRSLTELDVDFARLPGSGKSSLRPAVSMDHVPLKQGPPGNRGQVLQGQLDSGLDSQAPERSNSVPDVGAALQVGHLTRGSANNNVSSPSPSPSPFIQHHSPDLILSPDYDYDRLELKSSSTPTSPHNSVSYV